jgi:SOS response regulatory protein OraA/RecX
VNFDDFEVKLLTKILKFISLQPRSEHETVQRLTRYLTKFDDSKVNKVDVTNKIINYLKEDRLLDDARYAQEFSENIMGSSKARGVGYIKRFLMKKGISREIIESVTQNVDPDVEFAAAKELCLKKLKTIKAKNQLDLKKKLWSYLSYRGFSPNVIGLAIDSVVAVD